MVRFRKIERSPSFLLGVFHELCTFAQGGGSVLCILTKNVHKHRGKRFLRERNRENGRKKRLAAVTTEFQVGLPTGVGGGGVFWIFLRQHSVLAMSLWACPPPAATKFGPAFYKKNLL